MSVARRHGRRGIRVGARWVFNYCLALYGPTVDARSRLNEYISESIDLGCLEVRRTRLEPSAYPSQADRSVPIHRTGTSMAN